MTFSGRQASQHPEELAGFIALLQSRGVRSYLEIGTRHGDTFHEIMLALPEGSRGVAVDLPGALWGINSSRDHLNRAVADLCAKGRPCSSLFGDSQTDATRRLVVGRGPYDAALIDGDHTYQGVLRDWQQYRKIAPIIAFHDIVGTGQAEKVHGNPVEVPRLWAELKACGLETVEFIGEGSTMGIGVVLNA
jgi:predicted O-methyltransferase YrrM